MQPHPRNPRPLTGRPGRTRAPGLARLVACLLAAIALPGARDIIGDAHGAFAADNAARWIDVSAHGASGDGTADDTAAIRSAIAAVPPGQKGTVHFPRGTYVVTPRAAGDAFNPHSGISFVGDGPGQSVIRVADRVGDFRGIFYNNTGTVGDMTFRGLTFDGNSRGNPVSREGDVKNYRIAISPGAGANVLIENCEFLNFNGVWVVSDVGPGSRILNNTFRNLGADSPYRHDFSAVYAHAPDVQLVGNQFYGTVLSSADGANRTAIEIHGRNVLVADNYVDNMVGGIILTGCYEHDSTNMVVRGNRLRNVMVGIALWSASYGSHTSGYGLDGVSIEGNAITVRQTGNADVGTLAGIYWEELNTLPSRNISVVNNVIRFDTSVAPRNTSNPYVHGGIVFYWNNGAGPNVPLEGLTIANNLVDNAEGPGIFVAMNVKNGTIEGNTIVNPGQAMPSYRFGIGVGQLGAAGGPLVVRGNHISDNRAARRIVQGIVDMNTTPTEGPVSYIENEFFVRDTASPGTWYYYQLSGSGPRPVVRGRVPDFRKVQTTYLYGLGSTLVDGKTNRVYRAVKESAGAPGDQWRFQGWGTAAPADGAFAAQVGDIVWNAGDGDVVCWRCTRAGAPGTWQALTAAPR